MRKLRCSQCGHEWLAQPGRRDLAADCPRCRSTVSLAAPGHPTAPDSRFDLPSPPVPVAPERIGGFEVLGRLGSGGMGHVFLGRDPHLDRQVAIKLLRSDLFSDASAIERFLREAKAAARIAHPNVVGILHVALEHGVPFLVMEYVEGESAEGMLQRKGPLDLDESLRVLRGALAGLGAVHRHGIVHRDVKPANLLVGPDGNVKLTDFGLARFEEGGGEPLTRSGMLLGTPPYMPPEQWYHEAIDARTDIYALGVSWYHLLTGAYPLPATNPLEIVANLSSGTWIRIEERRPDLPPGYAEVLDRMTRRAIDERFASCEDVLAALEQAPAMKRPRLVVRLRRRRSLLAGVAAGAALALAAGVFAIAGGGPEETGPIEPGPIEPGGPPPPPAVPFAPRIALTTRLPATLGALRTDVEGTLEGEAPIRFLLVNGREVALEGSGPRRWRTTLEANEGEAVRLVARAIGTAGQEFEVELWRGSLEARGPEVNVTNLPAGPIEAGERFEFQGWASDPSGVARIELGGREASREEVGGRTFWRVEWDAAGDGALELAFVATDRAGNATRTVLRVDVRAAPEPARPVEPVPEPGPVEPEGPRRIGDLVVAEVELPDPAVTGLAFDPAGPGALYAVAAGGLLVRIDATTLQTTGRRELGTGAGGLAISARGLLVAAAGEQEVWVLDASLAPIARHPVPSVARVSSAPSLETAFAGAGERAEEISAIDLVTGAIRRHAARDLARSGREPIGGFGPFEVSPDGRWLFGSDGGRLLRFRVDGGKLTLEQVGPRIASDDAAIEFAAGGRLVALVAGGGNSKPDGRHHNTSGYGTYVYEVEALERPTLLIQSGAYPRALGHDPGRDRFLAHNHDFQLVLFDRAGTRLKEYRLTERPEDVLEFFADPARRRAFVCTRRDPMAKTVRVLAVTFPE